jgi:hypothetical protein
MENGFCGKQMNAKNADGFLDDENPLFHKLSARYWNGGGRDAPPKKIC